MDREQWEGVRQVSSSQRYGGPGVMDSGSGKYTVNAPTVGCTGMRKCAPSIVVPTILSVGVQGEWAAMYEQQPL